MRVDEFNKCKNNISYFIEKYCKLLTPNGIENIRLRDSQKKYLEYLNLNKHRNTKNMTREDILNVKSFKNN